MTLCDKFLEGKYCPYGARCQFAHPCHDFTDFGTTQRTPYQNLLHADSLIMKARIEMVEKPDIEKFSVCMPLQLKKDKKSGKPNHRRLAIFEEIAPS